MITKRSFIKSIILAASAPSLVLTPGALMRIKPVRVVSEYDIKNHWHRIIMGNLCQDMGNLYQDTPMWQGKLLSDRDSVLVKNQMMDYLIRS